MVLSQLAFAVGIKARNIFDVIQNFPHLERQLICSDDCGSNKKLVFAMIVRLLLEEDYALPGIAISQLECEKGHDFCSGIAGRLFNAMAGNWLSRKSQYRDAAKATTKHKVRKFQ
jgi:hypothetical protein